MAIKKQEVADFFDRCALWWDADMVRHEDILATILTLGGIREGIDVLDVACGTGVLFPDYLGRKVATVTGIDISPEMVKIAQGKFPQVNVICGDVEAQEFDKQFDAVMVYNAFPHFPDPGKLIEALSRWVKPGGRLSVAHGMSRAALTNHHKRATQVSIDLLHEKELAALMEPWFHVDVCISTDRMYQVSGVRRDGTAHSHSGHTHSHGEEGTPMEELLALMKYTVGHNDAHAQELAELAQDLKTAGKINAYRQVMDAVAQFDVANAKLDAVLKYLSAEE